MTCKLNRISKDNMIPDSTIMRHMAISHQKAMISNNCFPFIFCATVNSNAFTNGSRVANLNSGKFSNKFKILWNSTYNGAGKNMALFSNGSIFQYHRMRHNVCIVANRNSSFNYCKCINRHIITYLR